jgi:integrase
MEGIGFIEELLTGLWWSGLRLTEALNVYWDRLDRITIDVSSGRPMLEIPRGMQKNKKRQTYPVATEFSEMLLAIPDEQRTGPLFVVCTKTGKPYARNRHSVGKVIAKIGRKAGVVVSVDPETGDQEFASAHDLRRSFGDRWSKRVEAQLLKKLMRHKSIATTLKYYVGRDSEADAEDIDAAFNRSRAVRDYPYQPVDTGADGGRSGGL